MSGSALAALLAQGLREIGLPLGDTPIQQLLLYAMEIGRWTERVNLTGFREPERVVREGILRSLRLLPFLPEEEGVPLADVGSGAGFPGIPLKVARPGLRVTLIEASRRKATFLIHAIRLLGLDGISCLRARAEALGEQPSLRGSFRVVTARALAPLSKAIDLLVPLLAPGGILVIPQGRVAELSGGGPPEGQLLELKHLPATTLLPEETVAVLRPRDVSRET
ncbi:MAG TPA: 16S rRNA (guanine(527)-N(7))-methyltransferase RsmG [Candidatus Methylomirabilis sp.]|jgi:16S rRNA (guanine527-N7)-methyltransferase|nr:16S rRNA (guanine(527)-N(7))-methyltransferase RsmG [Candidatus Methylomirabilis sp.]